MSGSDDTNIRVWKSDKSTSYKLTNTREKAEINYRNKLINKFKYNSEVKRILKNKNLPKYIINNQNVRQIKKASNFRKLRNVELNSSNVNSLNLSTVAHKFGISKILDCNQETSKFLPSSVCSLIHFLI